MQAAADAFIAMEVWGMQFRRKCGTREVGQLRAAQAAFLCSQLATLLYFTGVAERPVKFPASMSYAASKGPPKYAMLFFWLIGWILMLELLWKLSSGLFGFAAQMVMTGVLTSGVNRPGQSQMRNKLHCVAAVLYIMDHILFMEVLDMHSAYKATFGVSFGLAAASFMYTGRIKRLAGLPAKYASSPKEWRALLKKAGPAWSSRLWVSELGFMLAENLIFTCFILGMCSGIQQVGE